MSDELGGSALYFALAASLLTPVAIVAPVGRHESELVERVLRDRPVDLAGLSVLDVPTYRWQARQVEGRNVDLGSQDSIYDSWEPRLEPGYKGWVFVGSMRPDRQVQTASQATYAPLLAGDAMRSYVTAAPADARRLLALCRWYFCNHQEFIALGGDPADPEPFRLKWGLEGLVLKAGPAGLAAYTDDRRLYLPALTAHPVVDTTGAGDAVAGGMLARWLATGGRPDGLLDALVWGVACASLAIGGIGLRSLAAARPDDLAARAAEVMAISGSAANPEDR